MPFEIGQRVGDYEILELLGTGGMGHVYRARNIISDRTEAMKVLLPDLSAERDLAVRFISEIRTLAAFDHPNIALLHTAFQSDNQLIMVMEYVEGYTLEQRAKQSPMTVADVTGYISQALSALSYAHARGVIHRDIKPANLMVTPHGVVKLMDFGIAKSNVDINLTRPGTTVGSFYYMSPEQVRGSNVDARSDLYSIGIVLYELLAGKRPFEADSTYGVLNQQLNETPRPPIEINPSLPPQLNAIILTALAKDPAARFQNADAFRNALKAFRTESPVAEANAAAAVAASAAGAVAASAAAPAFQNVSAPAQPFAGAAQSSPQKPPRSNKPLWIATGALAAIIALVAVAFTVPRMLKTHASESANTTNQPTTSAPSTADQAATTPPAASPADTGAPTTPPSSTAVTTAATATPPAPTPSAQPAAVAAPTVAGHAASARSIHKAIQPAQSSVPAASAEQQAAQTSAQATQEPSQEELDQLQERMVRLTARASAVDSSLNQLRSQQESQGLGLRNDMAAADSRMRSYMQAANRDLQSSRAAAAGKNMDKAEPEIDTLEKFLGK